MPVLFFHLQFTAKRRELLLFLMEKRMQSNILIVADMEGCTGVTDMRQYDVCREKMAEEVERVHAHS